MINRTKKPEISVIMSTYNSQECVTKSIQSILSQTFNDFEFLIMDDCSNDKTHQILKEFELNDKRIKVFKNDVNLGLTKSLNKLLRNSNGKYIARQDDDDISFKNRFYLQHKLLENSKYSVCTSRAKIIQNNKLRPKISHIFPQKFIIKYKNPFIHGTLMIERRLFYEIGYYNENFYLAQDYRLFFDLISKGYKVKQIKKPLYGLNISNNLSSNLKNEQKVFANYARRGINPISKNL